MSGASAWMTRISECTDIVQLNFTKSNRAISYTPFKSNKYTHLRHPSCVALDCCIISLSNVASSWRQQRLPLPPPPLLQRLKGHKYQILWAKFLSLSLSPSFSKRTYLPYTCLKSLSPLQPVPRLYQQPWRGHKGCLLSPRERKLI